MMVSWFHKVPGKKGHDSRKPEDFQVKKKLPVRQMAVKEQNPEKGRLHSICGRH